MSVTTNGVASRRRFASALTHPGTFAALAVLLANDVVFKRMWHGAWWTGKLSDLAWLVFAIPLLALVLSYVAGEREKVQRVVLFVAYFGLPTLYIAYNAYEPLHGLITSVLLSLSGASIGSPFDPTDSLVIPFGVGIALWIHQRPNHGPTTLRNRLVVLTAGVCAFATVASSSVYLPKEYLGQLDDDVLVLNMGWDRYSSGDGGLTWQRRRNTADAPTPVWAGQEVWTPRGTYRIEEQSVIREIDAESETVYTPSYLEHASNVRFQDYLDEIERRHFEGCPCPSSLLMNLAYHAPTGNIVVATAGEGVLVGDANANWMQVPIDRYVPTDFSLGNQLSTLLRDDNTPWAALAISILGIIAALAYTFVSTGVDIRISGRMQWAADCIDRFPLGPRMRDGAIVGFVGIVAIISAPIFVDVPVISELGILEDGNWLPTLMYISYCLVVFRLIPNAYEPDSMHDSCNAVKSIVGFMSVICSIVACIIVMVSAFDPGENLAGDDHFDVRMPLLISFVTLTVPVAIASLRPPLRFMPVVFLAFLGMMALFFFAMTVGVLQGFNLVAAQIYAVVLVALASLTLWRYLAR